MKRAIPNPTSTAEATIAAAAAAFTAPLAALVARSDGMTPTAAGSQATAAAIWGVMQQNCIAQ